MANIPSLTDSVVLITGGARGLGYAMVENFIKNGAKKVIIVDIDEENGQKAERTLGDVVEFRKCDITNDDEIDELINYVNEKYNGVQVVINNAGVAREANIKLSIAVNLTAMTTISLKFYNLPTPPHTIINISSVFGYRNDNGFIPVYQATKYGVVGLVKALGHKSNFEQTGIRVIGICPGMTRSDMTNALYQKLPLPEWKNKAIHDFLHTCPWQIPEDVGKAVVEAYKNGQSGSFWLIEGGKLEELNLG